MTSDNSYEERYAATLTQTKNTYVTSLNKWAVPTWDVNDIQRILDLIPKMEKNISLLNTIKVCVPPPKFTGEVESKYKQQQNELRAKREAIENERQTKIQKRKEAYLAEKQLVADYNNALSDQYREKHASLLQYKDALHDVFKRYDIKSYDLKLADNITIEEYSALIDQSVAICEKYTRQQDSKPINRFLDLVRNAQSPYISFALFGAAVIGAYISLPIAAVVAYTTMAKSLHGLYQDIDKLRIAARLMTEVDYDRFVKPDELKTFDKELTFDDIEKEAMLNMPEDVDFTKDIEAEKAQLDMIVAKLVEKADAMQKEIEELVKQKITALTDSLEQLKADKLMYIHNNPPFPAKIKDHNYFDHKYVLQQLKGITDVISEIPNSNLVFETSQSVRAVKNLKLYLCNLLLSVKPAQLRIKVFDPALAGDKLREFLVLDTSVFKDCIESIQSLHRKDFEREMNEIDKAIAEIDAQLEDINVPHTLTEEEQNKKSDLTKKKSDLISSKRKQFVEIDPIEVKSIFSERFSLEYKGKFVDVMKEAREVAAKNNDIKGTLTVDEYNKDAYSPIPYYVYICLSGFDDMFDVSNGKDSHAEEKEFFSTSARDGVHFWFLGNITPTPGIGVVSSQTTLANGIDYQNAIGDKTMQLYVRGITEEFETIQSCSLTLPNMIFSTTNRAQALLNLKARLCKAMVDMPIRQLVTHYVDPVYGTRDMAQFVKMDDAIYSEVEAAIMKARQDSVKAKVDKAAKKEAEVLTKLAKYQGKTDFTEEELDERAVIETELAEARKGKSKKADELKLDDCLRMFEQVMQMVDKPDISKTIDEIQALVNERFKKLGDITVDEYNARAVIEKKEPIDYQLYILLSGTEKYFEKTKEGHTHMAEIELFRDSAKFGIVIWFLGDIAPVEGITFVRSTKDDPSVYSNTIWHDAMTKFLNGVFSYQKPPVAYENTIMAKWVPREKWWTYDTIKGIDMHYGLLDGDFSKMPPMVIGDANVHSLLGGATGAGKSAIINMMLFTLIAMYPPSELQIVYIDFKNVEAAKFTTGYDTVNKTWMKKRVVDEKLRNGEYFTRVATIPHLRIISGTTDGEYALSIFEFLMEEMSRRQKVINKAQKTKVQELRETILADYNSEHNGNPKVGSWADMRRNWDWYKPNVYDVYGDLPRLLVIFDEFQVMYNTEFVPQKIIDSINGKITAVTKLARAMGCHLWFTSQSMKGTMSKDTMSNFSLRGALRCTTDVSTELIGNGAAGTIRDKFGYMYTNDSAGQSKEANKFWRVPYLDEKDLARYIDEMQPLCEQRNEKHLKAEFYDEKISVPAETLSEHYKAYASTYKPPLTLILGERAAYSTNIAPVAINLVEDIGEHIVFHAFDRGDLQNLIMTMFDNVHEKGESVIALAHSADSDTHMLLDLDNQVAEQFRAYSDVKTTSDDFYDAVCQTIDGRKARQDAGEKNFTPMYVFAIEWERCIRNDLRFQDNFIKELRVASQVGVHFFFFFKEKMDLQQWTVRLCNHRVVAFSPSNCEFFTGGSSTPSKLPNSEDTGRFAVYYYGGAETKFRIYKHVFTRELTSRMVVIKGDN